MKTALRPSLGVLLLVGLVALACRGPTSTAPSPSPEAKPGGNSTSAALSYTPKVEVVASGLNVPWAMAFAPDGRLFFTERPGRIRVISGGQLQEQPVATLGAASVSEAGLMGLALDPQFSQNHFMYVMYTYRDGIGLRNRVSRLVEANNQASDETVLLDGIPGNVIHDGGRLRFGPDGYLYVTTGDAGSSGQAQDANSLAGKILRLNPDGSVPQDNPFPGSPVYSFGHRNPQGLAWDPRTGLLFSTEHGPTGNDEVNIIEPGRNYGWPAVSGQAGDTRFVEPILAFSPAVAPSGATFYTGQQLSKWDGDLFFTALAGRRLHRVTLKAPDFRSVESHEALYSGVYGRLREVIQGPDGYLYFTTNNRDGRGSPTPEDDRILRIVPAPVTGN